MEVNKTTTQRGFDLNEFIDRSGCACSVQKSSLATEDAIWFGVNDSDPKIMATDAMKQGLPTGGKTCGWVPYEVPKEVLMNTHMQLTQDQVKDLLPILQHFAETGELPE